MKKILKTTLVGLLSFGLLSNCFGKFGAVKAVYSFNGNIQIGTGKLAGFFRSLLMIFPLYFAYGIGSFLDIVIFNLIEFWTDRNPIAMAEYDFDGKLVKEYSQDGQTITLTYTEWGKVLKMEAPTQKGTEAVYFLKEKPEKAFRLINGKYVEILQTSGPILPPAGVKLI
ncbi:DUF3332 family protein [Leptospira meyeri]|uniref:YD repeat-containing protein n=1 Tax=Leptospira meyeri TaxID=29508 RepID=A0A4R8N1E9_LEPME|nr:DUF3332 family protein [Leptospira meyeri]PKA25483.1 DUF3332 domain-containing protein [Leptospira sp. mixed culture ATI2-C-A1]EKJ88460.1 PF11810 domain protein [Leptospira meyeri serovar Hardjo str. Went 5]EMJ88850.1 PF11810 domain protein [Leptospira meyeri serovar Semaranga str. Veldrot Semarang 173]MCW7487922.1 DUF3332 domain-containing protein [Leptospira meyeri]PJZ81756.1 DUF3332 domain-containing protein [Leptospira meyeri]